MNAFQRVLVVASAALLGAGTSAFAQESTQPVENEVVGPPQLRDFTINGTVTREAPAPVDVRPREEPVTTAPQSRAESQDTVTRPTQPERERTQATARADAPDRQAPERTGSGSAAADLPAPTPAQRVSDSAIAPSDALSPEPQPASVPAPAEGTFGASPAELPILPWLIAALALIGAGGWYFLRQRPRESYAGGGSLNALDSPAPAPRPAPPTAPTPQPEAPAKAPSGGIVSTRLRPWLELEFVPQRAIVDDEKAAIAFELSVFNSGSVPARDVLLEASLFNAGPMQDQQIRNFFDNPVAKGDRIPMIPPLQRVSVNTAVFLTRDQLSPIEIEGRVLFVPMIAFNALYAWGGGKGQTSASYLVGKTTKSEKLAPFRLDLGPRVFRNLDARENALRLRD